MDIDTEITERLLRTLLLTAKLLDKTQDLSFPGFELTTTSYIILSYISENVTTTKQLAQKMQTTYANITHKTKTLEENGYIQRTVDVADKRSWQFHLTSKGQTALVTVRKRHGEFAGQLFSQFSDKDKLLIAAFLRGIEEHVAMIARHDSVLSSGSRAQKRKRESTKQ